MRYPITTSPHWLLPDHAVAVLLADWMLLGYLYRAIHFDWMKVMVSYSVR